MFKCEDGFAYIRRFGSTISIEPQNVDENEENWYFVLKAERNLKLNFQKIKWYDDLKIYNGLFHHKEYIYW